MIMSDTKLVIQATDKNFNDQVLSTEGIALVDFWAAWCGPCKALAPVIESIASEYKGQITVHKLNVDENPHTASQYEIRGIPTTLVFKNGELVDRIVGAVPKQVFEESIQKQLK
jgi:thioredoxin 1